MTFKETSAWLVLAALILIFGGYAWSLYEAGSFGAGTTRMMFFSIVTFVVVLIVAHIAVAIVAPKSANEAADERDRRIDLKAEEAGSFILHCAVLYALGAALIEGNYLLANILFLGLALSGIVKALCQVFLYRRSA